MFFSSSDMKIQSVMNLGQRTRLFFAWGVSWICLRQEFVSEYQNGGRSLRPLYIKLEFLNFAEKLSHDGMEIFVHLHVWKDAACLHLGVCSPRISLDSMLSAQAAGFLIFYLNAFEHMLFYCRPSFHPLLPLPIFECADR